MANKPRLVIVSGSFPKIQCGVSGHTELIARLTAARDDYEVHVLTADDPLIDARVVRGYELHPLVKKWDTFHARGVARTILSLQPDIVHIQNPTIKHYRFHALSMSVAAPYLKKLAPGVRVVVTQHDIAVGEPMFRCRYRPLFRAADAICVSNSRDEQAVWDQGIDRQKVYRAPVSSHFHLPRERTAEEAAEARQAFGIDPGRACLAYFGYIHPGRNIHRLLEAAAYLVHKKKYAVHALILGGPFPKHERYYQDCQKLAGQLGLESCVTWTGFASEEQIAQGLLGADCFVSLLERGADLRNTSILTAMLAQLPVVTTRNPRYYVDGDLESLGCSLVDPHNSGAIGEAIQQSIERPRDRDFLARRAAFFQPDKIWQQHIDTHYRAYQKLPPIPFAVNLDS